MIGTWIQSAANMRSRSGFRGEGIVFFLQQDEEIVCRLVVTDSRYTIAAKEECPDFEVIEYRGSVYETVFSTIIKKVGKELVAAMQLYYEDDCMTVAQFHRLQQQLKKMELNEIELLPLGEQLDELRQIKTEEELQWIEKAERIGDDAFSKILVKLREIRQAGDTITEKQVAAWLELYMKELGAEGTSFDTIAASGIHSSMPHAIPTDKVLEDGDFLTMDFGCKVNGYCSDMTRTIVYGKADEKQREIYDVVLQAQQKALSCVRAGMKGREVDEVARTVIRDAGYGECFGHSLGHSVGLEIHEKPCFSPKDENEIKPGMVITVEPGIYVEGFGGVRIEDVVVITENGCRNITHSPKELIEI